nr:immunoglobulin heavy chain junction region [Mus musculus]
HLLCRHSEGPIH